MSGFENRRSSGPPWATLTVCLAALAVQAMPHWFDALLWRREWLDSNEWWRLASGHLVHVSLEHLACDLSVFAILGIWLESRNRIRFAGTMGLAMVFADLLLRTTGRFEVYCGSSALGSAAFVLGACELLKGKDTALAWVGRVGLFAFLGKVVVEISAGRALFAESGLGDFAVAAEAHVAGAMAGLAGSALGRKKARPFEGGLGWRARSRQKRA